MVQQRGGRANDVMSQETGVPARPATRGLCDLGQGTSPLQASGEERSLIFSSDIP